MLCSLLLVVFSILFLFKVTRGRGSKQNLSLPPSPPKLPIIGNLHQLGTLPHRSFRALSDKYGPIIFLQLGNVPTIVVSSPEIAKEIMKDHDIDYASRPQIRAALTLLYGATDVAFCKYGEYWRRAKKICVSQLLSLKRVQSMKFLMEEEVADLVQTISSTCKNAKGASVINLGEMLVNLTCNIVSKATMSRKIEEKNGEISFGELTKKTMELIGAFCIKDYFPSLGWIDHFTGLVARLKETSEGLDACLDRVIEEHQISKTHEDDEKDFLDTLLGLQKNGNVGINLTQDNLKAIILDLFLGGIDTTSTTIEWAMTEMVRNPNTMKKVQEEVRRVIGNKKRIDDSDINQMVYLSCVVKETLRLHAPAPLLTLRESSTSTKLAGYDIPPKTRVYINAWAIQMDPRLWHNPDEFQPERFLSYNVDFAGNDFRFFPFGSGRRSCPGIHFATLQAELALANLLHWFDWKLPPGVSIENLDMSETFGLVVHKTKSLHLVPQLHHP